MSQTTVVSLAATFFLATGTGFGTIAACMGVPTGIELGVEPAFLAGAILGGAAFGDNLAPISDSTIASATAMEVDVPRCVRSRLKYSLTAAGITVAIMVIVGNVLDQSANIEELIAYDPKTLLMIIPVIITLFTAVKTGDLILATTVGSVLAGLTAVAFGLMDFIQIDVEDPARTALFSVSGEGLDRAVGGAVFDGLSSMTQMIVLVLLLFSAVHIMKLGHGDLKILDSLSCMTRTAVGSELVVSVMIIILS
ncbi:MAG: Na+/H+ antiporter NhaC family protein, partial [Blautia sp.]